MRTLYLMESGVQLRKKSNRIVVKKRGIPVEEVPTLDLKRLLVFGNSQLSTDLMRHLSANGVEVSFLSQTGRFRFRVVPESSKNIYLRMAQHDRHRQQGFRVAFGRSVVGAKLRNQRSLLVRYQRNQPEHDLSETLRRLKGYILQLPEKQTIEEIMGIEGIGSRAYFAAYGRLLKHGFEFAARRYHPAPDPTNALLSFGYMLLFNELNSMLEACGFDVFLGFLHSVRYGRASLATDLIEELRGPVVDRLVLYLVNKGTIKLSQFERKSQNAVLMDDDARKTYLRNYEKFVTTPFTEAGSKKRTTFRHIVRERVLLMERTLLKDEEYRPYIYY